MRHIYLLTVTCFMAVFLILSGCGGGGGSTSGGTGITLSAASGTVADGYLRGAKVCSDQNNNKRCDAGEPWTTTGAGGAYTLEGEDLDLYPIIVEVTAGVIDEDGMQPVAKGYLLSTPPGKPEFISPLTTMVQHQLENNPAMSVDDAEEVVKSQVGGSDEVDLFEDFVAQQGSGSPADEEYERLHYIAQAVASTLGQMKEEIDEVAEDLNFEDEDLDELVKIVFNRVLEQLDSISTGVDEQVDAPDFVPDAFSPIQVASGVVTSSMEEAPITPDTLVGEVEAAALEVVVGSIQELLEGDGIHWADIWEDNYDLELYTGVDTSTGNGDFHEDKYEYSFVDCEWQATSEDQEYFLTTAGWVLGTNVPDQVTYNDDGSAILSSSITGESRQVSVAEVELTENNISSLTSAMSPVFDFPLGAPPAGSKAYQLVSKHLVDLYTFEDDNDYVSYWSGQVETKIFFYDEFVDVFPKESGNSYFISHEYSLQFGIDGTIDILKNGTKVAEGAYTIETPGIYDVELMMLDLSVAILRAADIEGQLFFVELNDGIKLGSFVPANYIWPNEETLFNKTAMDFLWNAFEVNALEIPFAYVQWRTQEDSVSDRVRGWISLPNLMAYASVADVRLKNSSGVVVASLGQGDFHPEGTPASYHFIDCYSGTCSAFTSREAGYWGILPTDLPAGDYIYELENVCGDVAIGYVYYKGQQHLPVIPSATIEPVWNTDGSLTVDWVNPTTDFDWNLVDRLRINIETFNSPAPKGININLSPDHEESFTVSATHLNGYFTAEELEQLKVHMQTRVYDDVYDTNYARGRSDNVTLGDVPIPFAYVQWRTYEDSNENKIRAWISLPENLSYGDVDSLRLEHSGTVVASIVNGELRSAGDLWYRFLDCFSGVCSGHTSPDTGYSATLSGLSTGLYTYVLETVDGDILEKDVYYVQERSLPVVSSASIVPVWNQDGSLTVSWDNPSGDQNWDSVEKLRLNIRSFETQYSKTFIVNLPPTVNSFTVPAQEISGYFTESQLEQLAISVRTREYDVDYNSNYARGVSDDIAFGDFSIPFAYVQWRTFEDSSKDLVRGWITLPGDISPDDVAAIELRNSSGQIVASVATGEYEADSMAVDHYIDCLSGSCATYTGASEGYYATLPDSISTGVYTYHLETNQGETREKDVYYEQHKYLPVIPVASIATTWNLDGSFSIDFDRPTNDPDWAEVDQIRINVYLGSNERLVVKLPRDFVGPFTIAASAFDSLSADERLAVLVTMQTRAYDGNYDSNYARGWTGQPTFYQYDGVASQYDTLDDYSHGVVVGSDIDIASATVSVAATEITIEMEMAGNVDNINLINSGEMYIWNTYFDMDGDGATWLTDLHQDYDDFRVAVRQYQNGSAECVGIYNQVDENLDDSCEAVFTGNTLTITLNKTAFEHNHMSLFDIGSIIRSTPVRIKNIYRESDNADWLVDVMPNGW